MADTTETKSAGILRRDLVMAGTGAVLTFRIGNAETAFAQAGAISAPAQTVPPGKVALERRDAVLLVGIDRPQAQNLLDPPILVGLGKSILRAQA